MNELIYSISEHCETCGEAFDRTDKLVRECLSCIPKHNTSTRTASTMFKELEVDGKVIFECQFPHCRKKYANKGKATTEAHWYFHCKTRPFLCTESGSCMMSYRSRKHLVEHIRKKHFKKDDEFSDELAKKVLELKEENAMIYANIAEKLNIRQEYIGTLIKRARNLRDNAAKALKEPKNKIDFTMNEDEYSKIINQRSAETFQSLNEVLIT
jgi:hypothetical protein